MVASLFDSEASVRLPDQQLRALYALKAAIMLGLAAFVLVLKWTFLPHTQAEATLAFALVLVLPTLGVVFTGGTKRETMLAVSFLADVVVVTAGIHFGGGADNSSGPILYVVLIALAGTAVSARAAFRVTFGCAAAYAMMVAAERTRLLAHHVPYEKTTDDAIATVVIVSAYLFFVAWLVSYAARQIRALYLQVEEMRGETLGARSVTILVSDIEGFTALTERLGDRAAHALIEEHNTIVRGAVARHEGVEVEVQGDSFVIAFASAAAAVRCAADMQDTLERRNHRAAGDVVRVRIGLHTGEAHRAGERYFGPAVLEATRVSRHAGGGEVALSARVRDLVGEQLSVLACPYAVV